jgi:hypothetical protein
MRSNRTNKVAFQILLEGGEQSPKGLKADEELQKLETDEDRFVKQSP